MSHPEEEEGEGGTGAGGGEHREVLTNTRGTKCWCPMTDQLGALTSQPLALTAARRISLRPCSAGDAMVESKDSHWHHHSAGAVGAVRGGHCKATGQGWAMGGVTITNGRRNIF